MKKYMIFLFMTILFISLTVVAAEDTTDNTYIETASTAPQISTTTDAIQTDTHNSNNNEIITTTTAEDSSEEITDEIKTTSSSNKTHDKTANTIQKTQITNIKTASASEELRSLESSTRTNLLRAFSQAKIEIDNAQSTYEKEQVPNSVIQIANQVINDAQNAELIYARSGNSSLTNTIKNIRNNAEYARLLIHPEDLWNVQLAHQYLYRYEQELTYVNELGQQQIFTLWGQKKNQTAIITIDVTSVGWTGLYNDHNEIKHNGGFDENNQVISVNQSYFLEVMGNASQFTQIPYPLVRIYLESMYNQGFNYTRVYGGYIRDHDNKHINGTTLKFTTSSIIFWKMKKGSNPDEYYLTNERYYPDSITGHPPSNMPRASGNDEDGMYFVGYVIKNEEGGIHVDGVLIEYRAAEETINITVNKRWNDTNNQDGIRPPTATVQLLADGEKYGDNIVLHSGNNWSYNYINVPKYNARNEEIVYTINEVNVPTGYHVSYNNFTVINTHIPETVEIEAIKEWNDDYNRDGIRPNSVTVNLLRNGVRLSSATLNSANNWRARFTNLAKYQNGRLINYTVTENNIDSKYTTSIRRVDNEFIITNSYTPQRTSVTVNKIWDDNNNQDGIRAASVRFQLLENNEPVGTPVTLSSTNNWRYTFNDLPANAGGHAINYTVIELSVPDGYAAINNGLTITNKHTPEKTQIEVFKEWDDDHNRDGLRPASVTVNLYKNSALNQTVTLSASNNWRHYFNNLDVYENGNHITYSVTEKNITNYNTTITRTGNEFIIVNSHKPDTRNVTVQKIWDDNNNQDGIRPASVTFQLLANNAPYLNPVTLNARNSWIYTFTGLPVNANGTPVTYRTVETNIPDGYTATNNGLSVTNKHTPEKTQIEVFKEWDDDHNRDGLRPASVTVNLYKNSALNQTVTLSASNNWKHYFDNLDVYTDGTPIVYTVDEKNIEKYNTTITRTGNEFIIVNSHKPDTRNVTVQKIWDDNNNQDGIRPASVTFQLLANNEPYQNPVTLNARNNWIYTYTNLPVNTNGTPINYRTVETSIPAGYTATNNGLTITNTHKPETTELEVFKEWDDDHNRDGIRPASVTVNLLADGEVVEEVVLNHDTEWRYKFQDLAVYKNGKKITYTVNEKSINNYTTTISNINGEYVIVNSHKPVVKSLDVIKVWNDHDNEHELRPDSIQVQLFADGEKYGEYVTVSAANNWKYTYTDLPVNFDGKTIDYFVEEVGVPESYVKSIDFTGSNEITITNVFDPEHTQVDVIKEWDDNHDSDGLRPSSVQVQLYANGVEQGNPVTLSQSNYWRYSFVNLLKYIDDVEVEYTVKEVNSIPGYDSSVLTIVKNEFAIINKHEPEKVNITINKVWDDNNNQDGLRPESVRVELLADGEKYDTAVLNNDNGWSYTFTNLNKNFDGKEIEYAIDEIGIADGYTASHDGYTITNTHIPETTEIHVVKEWTDNDNQDGLRPDSITVTLLANSKTLQTLTLNPQNNWTQIISNLPKYENGKQIEYEVTETPVPNYTNTITNNNNKIIINNIHISQTRNLTINKIWNDNNNQDGIRPTNVQIQVLADGEPYTTITLSEQNKWTNTLTNIPSYYKGTLINYTLEEIGAPEGYTATINGYTITNTHKPETTEIHIVKEWTDNNNQDGLRPANVTVTLQGNGKTIRTLILNRQNNWTQVISNLPTNENGKAITYTVTETPVPNYTNTITNNNNKIIINNIHISQTRNLTINKIWNDNNNQDGIRPTNVQIQVLADGEPYTTITLSEQNKWTNTLTNIPSYYKGTLINYTLEEIGAPEGYTATINGYTITNTHKPETTEIHILKEWTDNNNQDGLRPDSITVTLLSNSKTLQTLVLNSENNWTQVLSSLPKYENEKAVRYTVTETPVPGYTNTVTYNNNKIIINNIHDPETINITINKNWNDSNNQDGLRPDSVPVTILKDGETYINTTLTGKNNWTVTIGNLPKFADGKEVKYTVDEVGTPEGYTSRTIGYTITNTHVPETIEVIVIVEWDDLDDIDEIRPENVTIILYKNDEPIENVTVSPDEDWRNIFDELPEYENGTKINYTADEILPDGYTRTIEINDNEIIITNIHRPQLVNITINKVWDDDNNRDGIRPENVQVQLLSDGKVYATVTLDDENSWKYSFLNLPKSKKGINIKYTLNEVTNITGYTSSVKGYTITNIHKPETVDVKVNVEWDDLNDTDKIRPENVTIILYADDEPVKNVTITPDDDWKTVFEDLPKYDNKTVINYTADEILPDGYNKTVDLGEYEINITNIHRPETVDVNVKIVWDDLDDVDKIRPSNVTVILYADGKPVDNVTVTKKTWKTSFEDLPKYNENSKLIKYTVDEVLPNGYTKKIESKGNNFTITNKHRPITEVNVEIVWDDLDDVDGIRPDNVTIILYADGKVVKNVTVTKDTWKTVFENLPKYDENGKLIKYTIDEVLPNGYTKTIESDGNNFVVTNVHRPATKNVTVQVKWDDLNDIDGIRPDNVTIRLHANGEVVSEVTITPEDDWNVVFDNLPQYDENGNPIEYTVDEVLPNGYTRTIESDGDNFVITNIHRPQLVWTWKLVEILDDNNHNNSNVTKPVNNQPVKIVGKKVSSYNNWKVNNRYGKYYRYNRYNRYNRYYRNNYRHYNGHVLSRHAYRLYIQLYNEYLAGNISFEDFIVLLEKEGVDTQILNFNEDGTITIDYDNIEDVPDKITVEYKNDDIPSTSDNIDTSNPDNNEAPVIDSGKVEVKSESSNVQSEDSGVEE